jgi:hypothetical protein
MARPDLSTPDGRDAYTGELRRIAWPYRLGGLVLVVAATALIVAVRGRGESLIHSSLGQTGLALMALGWAVLILAIAKRTAHHRKRMAEPD